MPDYDPRRDFRADKRKPIGTPDRTTVAYPGTPKRTPPRTPQPNGNKTPEQPAPKSVATFTDETAS